MKHKRPNRKTRRLTANQWVARMRKWGSCSIAKTPCGFDQHEHPAGSGRRPFWLDAQIADWCVGHWAGPEDWSLPTESRARTVSRIMEEHVNS